MNAAESVPASRLSVYRTLVDAGSRHGVAHWTQSTEPPRGEPGEQIASSFEAEVATMSVWCRVVERLVIANALTAEARDAIVHAGFERLSRIAPVLDRYRSIGASARSLHVYGEPDAAPSAEGMSTVAFRGGPLASEWFLIVDSARFRTVLAAKDLDGFESGRPMRARRFSALACHHPKVVADVRPALENERARLLRRLDLGGAALARGESD